MMIENNDELLSVSYSQESRDKPRDTKNCFIKLVRDKDIDERSSKKWKKCESKVIK